MDALLLCCAVVALVSHECALESLGYEQTTEVTHRRHVRAADAWLGYGARDDSVVILELADQNIQQVPRAAFRNTPNVFRISLSDNRISVVDVGAFEGVPLLSVLDLDNNDISVLPEGVFGPVPKLMILSLDGNRIAELSPNHFAGLPLFEMELSGNKVELKLHNRTFANLPELQNIQLSGSNIRTLPRDLFTDSTQLVLIYLSDNNIEELDNLLFHGLDTLNELDLSGNRLQVLQPAVFDELPSLEELDLSRNSINYLSNEQMHFRWSPRVNLTYNKIKYFDPYVYDSKRQVPEFILDNNPFHCCSSLLPFVHVYSKQDVKLALDIDGATCAEPAALRGTKLNQLSEDSLGDCNTTQFTTPGTPIDSTPIQSSEMPPPTPLPSAAPSVSPPSSRNNIFYISGPLLCIITFIIKEIHKITF